MSECHLGVSRNGNSIHVKDNTRAFPTIRAPIAVVLPLACPESAIYTEGGVLDRCNLNISLNKSREVTLQSR